MVEEGFGFDALELAEQLDLRVGGRFADGTLAEINERVRVPIAVHNECGTRRGDVPGFEKRGGTSSDLGEGRVISGAPEPIAGVGEIRLAAMDDGVEEAAVGSFDLLRDNMRGLQVIVPEQHEAADDVTGISGQRGAEKDGFETLIQPGLSQDVGARSRAKLRQAGGSEQLAEVAGWGFRCHDGGKLGSVGASFNAFSGHFRPIFRERNGRRFVHKPHNVFCRIPRLSSEKGLRERSERG